MIMDYLKKNLLQGFRVPPWPVLPRIWGIVALYVVFALWVGFLFPLLSLEMLQSNLAPFLPFTLFVFPSLLEEAFFRGVLIPADTAVKGPRHTFMVVASSSVLFVLWHPLNALTVNPGALPVFTDPAFLAIVLALGFVCGYSYVISKSLWIPIIIHWATVLLWVFFLGGRNLVVQG